MWDREYQITIDELINNKYEPEERKYDGTNYRAYFCPKCGAFVGLRETDGTMVHQATRDKNGHVILWR